MPDDFEGLGGETAVSEAPSSTSNDLEGLSDTPAPSSVAQPTSTSTTSLPDSMEGLGDTPTTAPSLLQGVSSSPIGVAASGAGLLNEGLENVATGIGKAWNYAVGTPTSDTEAIANAPKTVIEGATKLEQIPENLVKRSLGWMEGLSDQPSLPTDTTLQGEAPTFHDLLSHSIKGLSPEATEEASKSIGMIGELVGDPMWFLHLGGLTKLGEAATKEGLLEPNIGKAGDAGQRALLTVGKTPLIKGQPILNAIGAGQTALRKAAPGFHTMTEDPEFNAHAERAYTSPGSNAEHQADVQGNSFNKAVKETLKSKTIDPDTLKAEMINYREPPGTVGQEVDPSEIQSYRAQSALPQNLKDILDQQIEDNKSYATSEGKVPSENYLLHIQTPEWQKFKDEHFNAQEGGVGSGSPKNDSIQADIEREIANHGVNEANELSQSGKLGELFPNNPFQNTLNGFKGKIFSDDLAHIEGNRAIQNANVLRTKDFMEGVKQFAIPPGKIDENPKLTKNYSPVDSADHFSNEGGRLWFPKEQADFINGLNKPELADKNRVWAKGFKNVLEGTSTLTKLVNFGLKPASAPFNYLSNLNLQYLNKLFSANNVQKGLRIISNDRMNKLSDKIVLKSPKYGEITEKKLMDMAHRNRGIGMGLEKSEIANARLPQVLWDNKVVKGAMAVHMFAEDASRLPAFMTALERGSTWEGAALQTRKALYDYSDLGPADQAIAKYVPFYRFARMNMPKMVERMISEPARTTAIEKARESWNRSQGQQQNENNLPGYEREEEPWALNNNKDSPTWVEGGRYMTQNDINRPFGNPDVFGETDPAKAALMYAAGMVNPFLKTPIEEMANTNFNSGTPIAQNPKANHGLGEMRDLVPGLAMPAKIEYALNQLSPFSMVRAGLDQTVPGPLRALHELGGVNAFTQQPEVDQTYKDTQVKKGLNGLADAITLFSRKYASDEAHGKTRQAELDRQNREDALKEQEELAPKALGALQ